jgi:TRAP-type C4-dicarboxylate transport system permease small subunit
MNRQKIIALSLLAFIGILVFILSTQASQIRLADGTPVALARRVEVEQGLGVDPKAGEQLMSLMRAMLLCVGILMPLSLFYMLFTKRGRKDLIIVLVNAVLLFLMVTSLQRIIPQNYEVPTPTPAPENIQEEPTLADLSDGEGGSSFVANPPEWAIWVGSLVLAVIFALLITIAYLRFFRRRQNVNILQELADEAQQAIDDIQAGGDLRQIIINCYRDMMSVVKKTRGITREDAMTPDEFELLLERRGLPAGPLQRLTRLFEDVRYGNREPSNKEEQLALLCLQELVTACQKEEGVR